MVETFRLKKSVKYQGMVFAAIFVAALVGYSSLFFLEEPARHGFKGEHSLVIVAGMGLVVFGTMLLLSVYVSELQSLTWRSRSRGGTIVFCVLGAKSRLDLYSYAEGDRLRIIKTLYDLVPAALQEGWPEFCHKVTSTCAD
jgi:hypothetical protein